MISVDAAIHRHIADDFEAEPKVRMDPASRRLARTRWLDEAVAPHLLVQFILRWRAEVEIAGRDGAARIIFHGGTAAQPRPWQSSRGHCLADAREQAQCRLELGAIEAHSAATASRFPATFPSLPRSNGARY